MEEWDKEEKDNEFPTFIDKLLHSKNLNWIYFDENKSESDQFDEIVSKMKCGSINVTLPKTW